MNDEQPTPLRRRTKNLGELQRRALNHSLRRTQAHQPLFWPRLIASIARVIQRLSALPPRYGLHMLILSIASSALLFGRIPLAPQIATPFSSAPDSAGSRAAASEQRPFLGVSAPLPEPQTPVIAADTALIPAPDTLVAVSTRGEMGLGGVFQPISAAISADIANLRTGPGTAFDKVAVLAQTEPITVLARSDNWLNIQAAGSQSAWIAADLVELSPEALEALPVAESVPAPPPPLIAQASVGELNLRDGPGTDYVGLTKLSEGTQLDLVAQAGEWLKVQTEDGSSGWVKTAYLNLQAGVLERVPETGDIPPVDPDLLAAASESGINLRAGPGTDYSSLGKLQAGADLTLLARYKTWYKVQTSSGDKGWVASDLLEVSGFIQRRVPTTSDIPALPKAVAAAPKASPKSSVAWVWPAAGTLTSTFGWRTLGGVSSLHDGIDLANRQGTVIVAIRSGTVIQAGWCSGYGYCVIIDHGDGFQSEYGHMMSSPPVVIGQSVRAGQLIGYMGSTYDSAGGGYSTGTHLHLTLRRNGTAVNPLGYLP
jgi:murein DD-endopeptidase MepM/ murein hydrolase activator NlpD